MSSARLTNKAMKKPEVLNYDQISLS